MVVTLSLRAVPPAVSQGGADHRELDVGAGRARHAVVPVLPAAGALLRHRGAAAPRARRVRARRARGGAPPRLQPRAPPGQRTSLCLLSLSRFSLTPTSSFSLFSRKLLSLSFLSLSLPLTHSYSTHSLSLLSLSVLSLNSLLFLSLSLVRDAFRL